MTDREPPSSEQIVRAIGAMREAEREILILRRAEGLSYAEIADRLGIANAEVERRMADAIYAFARQLRRVRRPWWRRWL